MVFYEYFNIIFDKELPIYRPDETLYGKIEIKIIKRKKIKSFCLLANGSSHFEWIDKKERRGNNNKELETHFKIRQDLITKQVDDKTDLYLEIGSYIFPFKIKLPDDLPTSYENFNCQIDYYIEAAIDISWFLDKKIRKSFTVIKPLDFPPDLKNSYPIMAKKQFLNLFKSKAIIVTLKLDKSGFVCGEPINFNININNQTASQVKNMRLFFYRKTTIIKNGNINKFKKIMENIALIDLSEKVDSERIVDLDHQLIIPPVCPTIKDNKSKIEIEYGLNLKFNTSGISMSKNIYTPIFIGTEISQDYPNKDKLQLFYDNIEKNENKAFNILYPFYIGFDNLKDSDC